MAGKGDKYRKVNKQKFDENYERIFGKRSFNVSDKIRKELEKIKRIPK